MNWKLEREWAQQTRAQVDAVEAQAAQLAEQLAEAETNLCDCKCAQEVLQQIAQGIQQQAHAQIASVVSRCLAAVFPDPYEFEIVFEEKRGKTDARLVFKRDGEEVHPLSSSGGGVVDVAAFGLRLACLLLARPRLRQLLVLDEPFRFVSLHYQANVVALLQELTEEFDVQIIMVTHNKDLMIGSVVEIK